MIPDSQAVEVMFYPILFGMLTIDCPTCDHESGGVFVGLTTLEDEENPVTIEGLPNLRQMGVIAYPCGHIFCSACLTDKVARIINARERDELRVSMFTNLIECKEHGVEFPEQG